MLTVWISGISGIPAAASGLSGLDKMWASFVAMGLMAAASLLITFARTRTKGVVRVVLSVVAFLLFVPILLYMIASML